MTDQGNKSISDDLMNLIQEEKDHLSEYINENKKETGEYPIVVDEDNVDDYETKYPNLIYKISDNVFVHIYGERGVEKQYTVIEPNKPDKELFEKIKNTMLDVSSNFNFPDDDKKQKEDFIETLVDNICVFEDDSYVSKFRIKYMNKINVTKKEYNNILYYLKRDIAGIGELEPVMNDSNNEDIHVIGNDLCNVDHSAFDLIKTNVGFDSNKELTNYLKRIGERIDKPMNDAEPIVDGTLPDGSRLNVIFSDDVSVKGSSLTIRQGEDVPLSILQITKWGTLSPKLSAYLWLCLENEQTVFVVGETASGKTTTLNSILSFIPNNSKIYTAEDTAEVEPPQDTWQQLLTRESASESSTDVDMFDLVAAALRSRPDYIVVGEVRGEEAQMAFQAAQTGHPVLLTFHASDIKSMIQRFTSNPINVPETFMDNADVALFQNRVKQDNGDMLRRVTSVSEITGYSDRKDGVISKEVFTWDSADDKHIFKGQNNSYILEEQIGELLGYEDRSKIYEELDRREKIIKELIDNDVLDYYEVNNAIDIIQSDGVESLPYDINVR